ncbi:hypothetical protein F5887DRAFT_1160867 [Amanita rubescens]|nr:hypothetical protein F5887DRAFT_1160867 [Amanita rubescens]
MSKPILSADAQRRFSFLPEVYTFDPATVQGNVSDDLKRLAAKIYAHFVGKDKEIAFAPLVADRTRYTTINVYGVEDGKVVGKAWAESVHEVVVTKDMCNSFGTLHGACAALLLEGCTSSAIVILGLALGIDATGVSQAMNYVFHHPAKLGRTLRLVGTSLSFDGRIRTSRGELIGFDGLKDLGWRHALYILRPLIGPYRKDTRAEQAITRCSNPPIQEITFCICTRHISG